MNLAAILGLGFVLGMRHATDADHVVAVTTLVTRKRSLRAALPIGALWGLGHTATILVVGGAIVVLGVAVPPRLGLGLEMLVALMLVLLGVVSLRGLVRGEADAGHGHGHGHALAAGEASPGGARLAAVRPFAVGVVHGLAGSAAVALLVVGAVPEPAWAVGYLLVFGLGTVVGMLVITAAMAAPMLGAARRFASLPRRLTAATALASVGLGLSLVYQVGIVDGLFAAAPTWVPR